jgi:hypothetical protein
VETKCAAPKACDWSQQHGATGAQQLIGVVPSWRSSRHAPVAKKGKKFSKSKGKKQMDRVTPRDKAKVASD